MIKEQQEKIFLVINLSYFGDVLLTNSLCQNIKNSYPDSKIVFLTDKPFVEAAKYQYCVDDAIYIDKRGENKGFLGLLKFVLNCEYRNKVYAAFTMYDNDRGILISRLLNAQKRISGPSRAVKWMLTDIHKERSELIHMQDISGDFIRTLSGENGKLYPIKYITNPESDKLTQKIAQQYKDKSIISLCTVSKQKDKDMPIQTTIDIINKLNSQGKTVFYFGAGKACQDYATELKKNGCLKFVDLTNVTTINELANVMQLCEAVISIDTGTMHLAYATGVPTVCVFYRKEMIKKWAPRKSLYKSTVVIDNDYSAENICNQTFELIKNC